MLLEKLVFMFDLLPPLVGASGSAAWGAIPITASVPIFPILELGRQKLPSRAPPSIVIADKVSLSLDTMLASDVPVL